MRQLTTIGALAVVLCLAGCSSTALAAQGGGTHSNGANSTGASSNGTNAAPTATVVGTFRIQGGPYPGINRPLDGRIIIHANSATGHVVGSVSAVSGRFHTTIAPGRYVFVGKSARVGGVGCVASATAHADHTVHVDVRCDVP